MRKFAYIFAFFMLFVFDVRAADDAGTEIDAQTFVVSSVPQTVDYQSISKELIAIEEALKTGNFEPRTISRYVSYLASTASEMQENRKQLDSDLKNINRRIESLGEMPKDGEEELPVIAEKRKEYNDELVFQKGKIAEADLLINKAEELTMMISNLRKQALIGNLLYYQDPIIYPKNLLKATGEFVNFGFDILSSPVKWYADLLPENRDVVHSNVFLFFLMVAIALAVGIFLRVMIIKHLVYRKKLAGITPYFTKIMVAFFAACAYGIIPAVLLGGFLVWFKHTPILNSGFCGLVVTSLLYYALYVFLANAAIRVVFAPYNPRRRLISMDSAKAKMMTHTFYMSFFMIGAAAMLKHIAEQANYSIELIYFLSVISVIVKTFCIVWIIKRYFWEKAFAEVENSANEETQDSADTGTSYALRVILFSMVSAVIIIGIALFGYPRLSLFIVNRFMISVLLVVILLMVRKAVFELIRRLFLLGFWFKKLRLRRQMLTKIDFWLNVTLDPIFSILGLLVILTLWGVSTDILLHSVKKLFFGFKIGDVEISLVLVMLAIAVFFVSIAVFRILRRKFVENILSHVDIDDGIKHSLASGFGFVGFVISIMLAMVVMGADLSNLALVAGALSVGIGLGLQNIVNNFVSGIILLFERPIKVGDWVIINGEEGTVKQINIRSTEIETFNRASVIVPNATVLSNSLINLTHGNNWMRFSVKVGVAYGTDVEKVKQILLECATKNRRVMKKPEPYVLFQDFGSSSLDFEVRGYSNNIWDGWLIPSELRFEINRRFIEEGIEIPFNQIVVHNADVSVEENK